MKIAISCESTVDLTKELLDKYDVKVIPYEIVLDGKAYKDGEISPTELFEFVDKTGILPKTTALNSFEYQEFFSALKKDYDAVIHIALSSGITSSTSHAVLASKEVENVFVVDSKSLTSGIGMLAVYARQLAEQGLAPQEIYEKVSKRTDALSVSFVIERLDYLYKGGRCNTLQYLGANLLKLRPSICVKNGKMDTNKKYRGKMDAVVSKYCEDLFSEDTHPDKSMAFITYTTATPEMIKNAEIACQNEGFKTVYKTVAGTTVSSHCGANTLGIIFFNDGE